MTQMQATQKIKPPGKTSPFLGLVTLATIGLAAVAHGDTAPAPTPFPYTAQTVEVPSNEDRIVCVVGDTLHFAGGLTNAGYSAVYLECNHRIIDTTPIEVGIDSSAPYSLKWAAPAPGVYHLKFGGQREHGGLSPSRALTVTVLGAAPLTLCTLPVSAVGDVPASALPLDTSGFRPASVKFVCHGQSVSAQVGRTFAARLPLGALPTGIYTVSMQAWDGDGNYFAGPSETVTVPDRITVTSEGVYTMTAPADRMPLSVKITDGVTPSLVTYSVDGQKIVESGTAPFTASADLSSFHTGTHRLSARLVSPEGYGFDAPDLTLKYVNAVEDADTAKQAKEEADRAAAVRIAQANAQAAQANAIAAQEASKDRGPLGPGRKALRTYLATHPELGLFQDVKDVRKSDSVAFPSDIYAMIINAQGQPRRVVFSANLETGDFSDMVKSW